MLTFPSGEQRLGIAIEPERNRPFTGRRPNAVLLVDFLNPVDRRQLVARLARITEEVERAGADHGMRGDLLGRGEVALQRRILHELDGADVRESFAADGITDKVAVEVQI